MVGRLKKGYNVSIIIVSSKREKGGTHRAKNHRLFMCFPANHHPYSEFDTTAL